MQQHEQLLTSLAESAIIVGMEQLPATITTTDRYGVNTDYVLRGRHPSTKTSAGEPYIVYELATNPKVFTVLHPDWVRQIVNGRSGISMGAVGTITETLSIESSAPAPSPRRYVLCHQ